MKERFGIERVFVVSDRGMISAGVIKELKTEGIHEILGIRMRRNANMTEELLEGSECPRSAPVPEGPGAAVGQGEDRQLKAV